MSIKKTFIQNYRVRESDVIVVIVIVYFKTIFRYACINVCKLLVYGSARVCNDTNKVVVVVVVVDIC